MERRGNALGVLVDALGDVLFLDAAEHLDGIHRDAGDLDALGERNAVAIEDGASFGLDVEAPLPLAFSDLEPLRPIAVLNAVCPRHDKAEPKPHESTKDRHADLDPASACGPQVPHGDSPLSPVSARTFKREAGTGAFESTITRSGGGGLMPNRLRATRSTRSGVR